MELADARHARPVGSREIRVRRPLMEFKYARLVAEKLYPIDYQHAANVRPRLTEIPPMTGRALRARHISRAASFLLAGRKRRVIRACVLV